MSRLGKLNITYSKLRETIIQNYKSYFKQKLAGWLIKLGKTG